LEEAQCDGIYLIWWRERAGRRSV